MPECSANATTKCVSTATNDCDQPFITETATMGKEGRQLLGRRYIAQSTQRAQNAENVGPQPLLKKELTIEVDITNSQNSLQKATEPQK